MHRKNSPKHSRTSKRSVYSKGAKPTAGAALAAHAAPDAGLLFQFVNLTSANVQDAELARMQIGDVRALHEIIARHLDRDRPRASVLARIVANNLEWQIRWSPDLLVLGRRGCDESDSTERVVIDPEQHAILLPSDYDSADLGWALVKVFEYSSGREWKVPEVAAPAAQAAEKAQGAE